MSLTSAQLATLKAFIANTPELAAQPNNTDGAIAVANALNALASPSYLVWRSNMTRAEIYNGTSAAATPTTWDWTLYKNQGVAEQNAWTQMFMGDQADFGKLNLRVGISKIFTAGSAPNRDHAFAISQRPATVAEKLFAVAVTSPPANSGNTAGQPRGSISNPDVLVFEGLVSSAEVEQARNS